MQSYYEINVSFYGQHLFATAPRSLTNVVSAQALYNVLSTKFPASEGYKVTTTKWEAVGKEVQF